jgi:SHAQKYF class myb-like DNA-binding protein
MTWVPSLHRDFLKALTTLGLRSAVPKTIMQARPLPCTDAALPHSVATALLPMSLHLCGHVHDAFKSAFKCHHTLCCHDQQTPLCRT